MTDKEKQIEEMAKDFALNIYWEEDEIPTINCLETATRLYLVGYRKHTEGEWTRIEVKGKNYAQVYYQHNDCEVNETQMFPSPHNFCPNCGRNMKGGAHE